MANIKPDFWIDLATIESQDLNHDVVDSSDYTPKSRTVWALDGLLFADNECVNLT